MESKCHNFFTQAKIHKFSKLYILNIIHIFIYVCKSFSTIFDKGLRKTKRSRRGDGEIGTQTKLNGSAEYEIEKVKQTR